jgi:hypothetical protein
MLGHIAPQFMEEQQIIELTGFDPLGEPEIRVEANGSLWLVFNFMPPSWAAEDDPERFDTFDEQLHEAIGVPVLWDDREFFFIDEPAADTVERITKFLQTFKR